MLEKLCRAHAICATNIAEDLLRRIGDQLLPLNPLHDGSSVQKRVVFYAENLLKEGPLTDLAADAIVFFSRHYDVVVVVGVGSDYNSSAVTYPRHCGCVGSESDYNSSDTLHPPVKELCEHFPKNA